MFFQEEEPPPPHFLQSGVQTASPDTLMDREINLLGWDQHEKKRT